MSGQPFNRHPGKQDCLSKPNRCARASETSLLWVKPTPALLLRKVQGPLVRCKASGVGVGCEGAPSEDNGDVADARIAKAVERKAQVLERGVCLERPRYYPRPLSSRPVSTSSHPVSVSSHQRCWSLKITMLRSPIVRTSRQDPITSRQHLSTSRQHAITSEVSVSSDPAISCTHVISSGQRVVMSSQHLAQHHQHVVTSGMVSSDPAITGAPCHHVRPAHHQTQSSVT